MCVCVCARMRACLSLSFLPRLQRFPEEELLRCPSEEAVEAHFMATIKEVGISCMYNAGQ